MDHHKTTIEPSINDQLHLQDNQSPSITQRFKMQFKTLSIAAFLLGASSVLAAPTPYGGMYSNIKRS